MMNDGTFRASKREVLSFRSAFSLLFLLSVLLAPAACRREKSDHHFPDAPIILISIDTLRADHLPAYGYQGVRTPAIDRLRDDSILFRNAYSHCPLTLPSHVSVLTGLLPTETAVRDNIGYRFDSNKHPTVAALLKQKGYATGAAVSSYVLRADTGLGGDFDWYDDETEGRRGATVGELQRAGGKTSDAALHWIATQGKKPFFLFLHLYEPHTPYEPPEPHRSAYAASPYDGEIAAVDDIVGRFLEELKTSGVYDRSTVILISDHGEGLSDHGEEEHGIFLYREAIHVPLMIKLPKSEDAGSEVTAPVQLSDIFPTLGQLAGAQSPPRGDAVSLLEVASGKLPAKRRIYSETYYPRIHFGWSQLRSLVDDRHHFIDGPSPELYDVVSDPGERQNILKESRRIYAELRSALQQLPEKFELSANVSPEEAAKLAALGYLGSPAAASAGPLPDPRAHIATVGRFRQGVALVAANRNAEAVALLRSIVKQEPGITDVWAQLGKAYEQLGEYDEALAAYKEAAQRSPSVASKFVIAMASVYLYKNDVDQAESHARAGYEADTHLANLILGIVALERGKFQEAEKHARVAMEEGLYKDSAIVLMARAKVREKRPDEAIRMLDELKVDLQKRNAQPPALMEFVRGDALMRMGRAAEAEAAFLSEIENFPRDTEAYGSLAAIYMSKGEPDRAESILERMVRANPQGSSYALAAQLFSHFGDAKRAESFRRRLPRSSRNLSGG